MTPTSALTATPEQPLHEQRGVRHLMTTEHWPVFPCQKDGAIMAIDFAPDGEPGWRFDGLSPEPYFVDMPTLLAHSLLALAAVRAMWASGPAAAGFTRNTAAERTPPSGSGR